MKQHSLSGQNVLKEICPEVIKGDKADCNWKRKNNFQALSVDESNCEAKNTNLTKIQEPPEKTKDAHKES